MWVWFNRFPVLDAMTFFKESILKVSWDKILHQMVRLIGDDKTINPCFLKFFQSFNDAWEWFGMSILIFQIKGHVYAI